MPQPNKANGADQFSPPVGARLNYDKEGVQLPKIILWLMKIDELKCSQFTLDWIEGVVSMYQDMAEEDCLPSENDANGAIEYEVKNILEIMKPDLIDREFFNQILAQVT